MNSIANMKKLTPTPESAALDNAMADRRVHNATLARHVKVSDGLVSQWRTGRRPVPAHYAPKVAGFLDMQDPALISAQYAQVRAAQTGNGVAIPGVDAFPDDLALRRLENAIDELRHAVAAMITASIIHRPAEARDVAKAIRRHAAPRSLRSGLLAELLQALEKA